MPKIYYARHGETDWNVAGRLQGGIDIALNARGREQAAHAGTVLAELLALDGRDAASLPFVSSPLARARVTMELMREVLGLPSDGYALDDRLREIGYGHWEGSTLAQIRESHPALYAERELDKWRSLPPSGETYADVGVRMRLWYDELSSDTIAVAHGGTARALMVALGFETPENAVNLTIEQGVIYVFDESGYTKHG